MNDKIYILREPKKQIITHVLVDRIPTEKHQAVLDILREISDLFFIIPESLKVDKKKLTNLYLACGWLEGNEAYSELLTNALAYDQEVWSKQHKFFLLTDLENIPETILPEKIEAAALAGIVKPYMEIHRTPASEIAEIVIPSEKKKWWSKAKASQDRLWSTYGSSSPILFLRESTVRLMLGDWDSESFLEYLRTFTEQDFRYYVASYLKKLGLDNINGNIEEYEATRIQS